jgi:hypothetical protein
MAGQSRFAPEADHRMRAVHAHRYHAVYADGLLTMLEAEKSHQLPLKITTVTRPPTVCHKRSFTARKINTR